MNHFHLGKFGQSYDAQVAGLSLNHDHPISGEKFAFFSYSGETRVSTWGIGPHSSGSSISFALWIRTWIQEEMILVHYGAAWRNDVYDSESDIFSLTLANGRPRLYARENKILTTETNISLNDGQWHHIAVSMPYNNCLLANVEMIIDGKKVKTKGPEKDEALFFIHYGRVSLGGLGYSDSVYETRFPNWNPYKGSMDRFLLWARPLYNWDLAWSMNKNFQKFLGSACDDKNVSSKRVFEKKRSRKYCRVRCKKLPWCFGYQALASDDDTFQCTLYGDRPKEGDPTGENKSICAAVM